MVNFIFLSDLYSKILFFVIRVKIIKKWNTKIGRDYYLMMFLGDSNVSIFRFRLIFYK